MELKRFYKDNKLLIFTVLGVIAGLIVGALLYSFVKIEDTRKDALFIECLNFPGELMMRAFKLVMIPILITSIISGVTNLGTQNSGNIGKLAFLYIFFKKKIDRLFRSVMVFELNFFISLLRRLLL